MQPFELSGPLARGNFAFTGLCYGGDLSGPSVALNQLIVCKSLHGHTLKKSPANRAKSQEQQPVVVICKRTLFPFSSGFQAEAELNALADRAS